MVPGVGLPSPFTSLQHAALLPQRLPFMSPQTCDDPTRHDILRLLAYHPKDHDQFVLRIPHERNWTINIVDSGHFSALGDLDVLPVEMINEVLRMSDLRTISMLRLVSRRARVVVHAFIPYKLILTHAPHVLDALTRTGVAHHFTAVQVLNVLRSSFCAICGRFGAFLWIPDCIRCCIRCVRESPKLLPMTERDAKAAFGLTPKTLSEVPIMDTLPGVYSPSEIQSKRKRRLLSQTRARQAAVVAHGGEERLIAYINSNTSQAKAAYDKRLVKWNATRSYFDSQGRINNTIDHLSRFLATTHLPYLDPISNSTQTGLSCKGCQAALESASHLVLSSNQFGFLIARRDQTFTEEIFLEHFNNCTDAQRLWAGHQQSNGMASH